MTKERISRDKSIFIREIIKELEEQNVAVFAGAGLSAPAGFVGWGDLLRPIADGLGLDVDKESDLVALAQYHLNENASNRSELNKRLIEEFSQKAGTTENHRIFSRLPIKIFWTTNYDKLIETTLENSGKCVDVKYTTKHLALTKPKRDVIVYKMHGDVDHPDEAVLTKDDYESYHIKMDQYLRALSGDLISKTFIFIGFSFTDPNLDYILSRVRLAYDKSQRTHYCFLRMVIKTEYESEADFSYRKRKQELFVGDLKRFNIKALLVSEYDEITHLLKQIEDAYKFKSVFISGAAHEYGKWTDKDAQQFVHRLAKQLINKRLRIVSGFGLGIGSAVISGALEEIYMNPTKCDKEQLVLRPFPQEVFGDQERAKVWRSYRSDMISFAGIAIFIFGNKLVEGSIQLSSGMREEYELAKAQGSFILAIGATGYISEEIWKKERIEVKERYKENAEIIDLYEGLGDKGKNLSELECIVCKLIEKLEKGA